MNEQILKVGMVGVGNYGAARRNQMRQTSLFQIVACYDHNEQAMADALEKDGAKPCSSYEELLDTPDIEAMIISTGASTHKDLTIAALKKGLHVFVEKPLCTSREEIAELKEAYQKYGKVIGVGHVDNSNDGTLSKMKQMIDSGELGDIASFDKTTAHSGGLEIKPGDWRGDPNKNPGGMLFQCGVHAVHDLLFLFGPIKSVFCSLRHDVHSTQTADTAHCILEFESGLKGTLNAYHVTPYRHIFNIFGTKAALTKSDRYFDEGTTLVHQPRLSNKKEEQTLLNIEDQKHDPFGNIKSFFRAVRHGEPCYPSLIDGIRAVEVIFAAEESAKKACTIQIYNNNIT